ncbi:MAG: CFI-box-CTERM domain-containing protein [Acutalibacteraceae bacterium]
MKNDKIISLIAKLMSAESQNENSSDLSDKLYEYVNKNVLKTIENSNYIKKSSIRDEIVDKLDSLSIIADNPEIAGKTVIGIAACRHLNSNIISRVLPNNTTKLLNSSVPSIIYTSSENSYCAINKLGKNIYLTKEELNSCNFLYRDAEINIKSLVERFVIKTIEKTNDAAFIYFPYYSFNNSYQKLFDTVDYMILICSKTDLPKERIDALKNHYFGKVIILPIDEESWADVQNNTSSFTGCEFSDINSINDMINSLTVPRNNYCIEPELILPLLHIQKFLYDQITKKKQLLLDFNSDLLQLESEEVKQQTKEYKRQADAELENNNRAYFEIKECIENLQNITENYEKYFENYIVVQKDIKEFHKDYCSLYLKMIRLYSLMKDHEAITDCLRILKNHFNADTELLKEYLNFLENPKKIPDSLVEKAKKDGTCIGRFVLCGYCVHNKEYNNEIINYLSLKSKNELYEDELFYLGFCAEHDKKYEAANNYYLEAVRKGCIEAGDKLIQLNMFQNDETKKAVLEELSGYMVPEANFRLGLIYKDSDAEKSNVHMRLATACGHFNATFLMANKLFDVICQKNECSLVLTGRYKSLSNAYSKTDNINKASDSKKDFTKTEKDIHSVLKTYLLILSTDKETESILSTNENDKVINNIGVLYYLLGDYTNSITYLKKAQTGQSSYILGLIYENGYGVSGSLKKSFDYYQKAKKMNYPGAVAREAKVNGRLEREKAIKAEKEKELNEKLNEHSTSYGDSSLCFITTAVCESLGKPSNCSELEKLRDYRDIVLDKDPDGPAMIREYYRIAPGIVERINAVSEHKEIYKMLYEKYIVPTIEEFDVGNYSAAKARYAEMVMELYEKFPPQ